MCGISGFINFSKNFSKAELRKLGLSMAHTLSKRGPDAMGVWCDEAFGISLSHRRLSIIDLSKNANQPMVSKSGRFVLVYNGEIYNFKNLNLDLQKEGIKCKTSSDTEVLLEYLSFFGIDETLTKINGIFSFVVWDRKLNKLCMARDRAGVKPLYFYNDKSTIAFASELKALKRLSWLELEIDEESVSSYVRLNYIPSPYSIFKKVLKVEPGQIIEINLKNNITKKKFWRIEKFSKEKYNSSPNDTFEILNLAVRNQMISDVPLGVFLSGGVDSSLITALSQINSNKSINSFTIGFEENEFDEAKYAKKISNHLGTTHNEVYFDYSSLNDLIDFLPSVYDEPFADSSQLPTFLLSEITQKKVKVALSGDGGDELFGGYYRYFLADRYNKYIFSQPKFLKLLMKKTINTLPLFFWNFAGLFLPNSFGGKQFGDKLFKLSHLLDNDDQTAFQKRIISNCNDLSQNMINSNEKQSKYFDKNFETIFPDIIKRMQVLDFSSYLPDDILTKVDRASMYNSLEVRVPFLDNLVIDHAFRLNRKHYLSNGNGKTILKEILYRFVPKELIDRPKMGFGIPLGKLLVKSFKEKIEYYLNSKNIENQKIFNIDFYRNLWQEHKEGKRNWQFLLWNFLVFQIWYEHWENS